MLKLPLIKSGHVQVQTGAELIWSQNNWINLPGVHWRLIEFDVDQCRSPLKANMSNSICLNRNAGWLSSTNKPKPTSAHSSNEAHDTDEHSDSSQVMKGDQARTEGFRRCTIHNFYIHLVWSVLNVSHPRIEPVQRATPQPQRQMSWLPLDASEGRPIGATAPWGGLKW